MKTIFYIFLGGGAGSCLRFYISQYTQQIFNWNNFPLGTLIVNILGCFFIGILSNFILKASYDELKFLLLVGFCGGFTTFSTLSYEGFSLWQNHQYWSAALYVFLSLGLGIGAIILGNYIIKYFYN